MTTAIVPYRQLAVWRPPRPSRWARFWGWLCSMAPVRLLLVLSVIGTAYLAVCFALYAPWVSVFAVIAYVVWRRRRPKPLTTLGSARWADARADLLPLSMISGGTGMVVGSVPGPRLTIREVVWVLFNRRFTAEQACEAFSRLVRRNQPPATVRLPATSCHVSVFGPPGSGKSSGIATPHLLDYQGSVIVCDMKGELYAAAASHRRTAFSHDVVCLDPFGVCGRPEHTLNVLDLIDPASPLAFDLIEALATALVVRTGHEKERHWDDCSEVVIAGMTAAALVFLPPSMRSLSTVREMVVDPEVRARAIEQMRESDAFGGLLARRGNQIKGYVGDEGASVWSSASRHLRVLDSPAIAANGESTNFDPEGLTLQR